jgi:hypothetical protein
MAWGLLTERLCKACRSFSNTHPAGICSTCRRELPLDGTVCRPCRKQASLVAGPGSKTALDLTAAAITGHQLFLAGTFRRPNRPGPRPARTAPQAASWRPPPARASQPHWIQAMLCDPPRDLTRVSSHHPPAGSGLAGTLLACAQRTAELRGWSPRTLSLASSGLRILAAVHDPGEPVRASTVQQLQARNIPARHVIDVLDQAGALLDDRPDSLTAWLEEQISGFPSQIRAELEVWIDVLRSGGTRRTPRARSTIVTSFSTIRPFLASVCGRYATLRQVTRQDITSWIAARPGRSRARDASTLRTLFRVLKSERLIFADPARGIRSGRNYSSIPIPARAPDLTAVSEAIRGNPALRVVVALTAVHAFQPGAVRRMRLDQVDLADRRLDPGGLNRPLDEFTAAAARDYLAFRRQRWPRTTNPHLLVNNHSAHTTATVSESWMAKLFCGLPLTAAQLREDRILEEARCGRADPLHLAAVFGFTPRTGLRYTEAARENTELTGQHTIQPPATPEFPALPRQKS